MDMSGYNHTDKSFDSLQYWVGIEQEDKRIDKLLGRLFMELHILERLMDSHMCKCLGLVQIGLHRLHLILDI